MPSVIDSKGATVRDAAVPDAFAGGSGAGKSNVMFRAVFRELSNRRAGTASTKRRDEVSRRRPQAVEAEGNRPRSARFDPFSAVASRRRGLRAQAAQLHRLAQ